MKKCLWGVAVFLIVGQMVWAQFYTRLPQDQRKELAEAYYLAGRQYANQGAREKGRAFEEMAYNIYPALNPSAIQLRELPDAALLILEGKARLAAVPSESPEAVQERLRSRFLRLVSSFLVENTGGMLALMDGSVYFTDLNAELSQDQIRTELDSFFAAVDLRGLVPSQVYDLNSLNVTRLSPALTRGWGESYAIRIRAKMDFSRQVAFWSTDQQYLMRRVNNRWLLFAVGQRTPPADWVPRKAPDPAQLQVSAALTALPVEVLQDNLLSALRYFLRKDVDRAARYFADEVRILRVGATLTRREIAETFKGYFESTDFAGTNADDIIDPGSIFVQPSDRFEDEVPGPAYVLTVKTRLDLSDRIPFWTRFQDYYFSREGDDWRIFAIF